MLVSFITLYLHQLLPLPVIRSNSLVNLMGEDIYQINVNSLTALLMGCSCNFYPTEVTFCLFTHNIKIVYILYVL